jgi:hypothetical protein
MEFPEILMLVALTDKTKFSNNILKEELVCPSLSLSLHPPLFQNEAEGIEPALDLKVVKYATRARMPETELQRNG